MDGRMHKKTAAWACRHVKDSIWQKYVNQVSKAGTYPDAYVFGEDAPDKTGWDPHWRELNQMLIDGKSTPIHRIYDTLRLRETYPAVLRMLAELSLKAFAEHDEELAVKGAGVMTHLVGDTIQPAHTTDNKLITMMWPQEKLGTRFMTHAFMERVLCDVDETAAYTPRTLGRDLDSFVWRLCEELEKGKQKSIAEIPVLMDAQFAGDQPAAIASAERVALACSKLDADILQTLSSLAGRDPSAMEQKVDLTKLAWVDAEVDNLYNYMPMVDMIPGRHHEHGTLLDIGEGPTAGLCILPMMAQSYMGIRDAWVTYDVKNCGYSRFCCKLALQHFHDPENDSYEGRGNETSVIFEIRLDGKTVFRTQPLSDRSQPVSVDVPLNHAAELMLYARDSREPNALTRFVYPVIAEPTLRL